MAVFGFLTDSDLNPLRDETAALRTENRIQDIKHDRLKESFDSLTKRVEALEQYCYNLGGDVSLLIKQRKEDEESLW